MLIIDGEEGIFLSATDDESGDDMSRAHGIGWLAEVGRIWLSPANEVKNSGVAQSCCVENARFSHSFPIFLGKIAETGRGWRCSGQVDLDRISQNRDSQEW